MILVNIRTAEVAYFSDFFSNFGTQSAIIAGIISGVISQTPGLQDYSCSYFWVFLYFTSSAAALVGAGHVLLTTLFTSVYGQGLALRGPLGSMVHTIDGMVYEQHQIVFAFIVTIFFFVLQEAGMFMIVMDELYGYISAGIVLVGMVVTYHYALRIYNRFHFEKERVDWEEEVNPVAEFNQMNPDHCESKERTVNMSAAQKKGLTSMNNVNVQKSDATKPLAGGGDDWSSVADLPASVVPEGGTATTTATLPGPANISEGYLAVKSAKRFVADPWDRRYFVLLDTNVFYYKDKRAYQLNPAEPINRRPIDLEGYTLVAGAVEPPYAISLIPIDADDIRKAWKFRCDTLAEFHNWVEIFTRALKICNSSSNNKSETAVH